MSEERDTRDNVIATLTTVKSLDKRFSVIETFMIEAPCKEHSGRIKDILGNINWAVRSSIVGLITGILALGTVIYGLVT